MRLAGIGASLFFLALGACTGPGSVPPGSGGGENPGDDEDVVAEPDGAPVPVDNRITTGLQALYRFDAGSGTKVNDVSGVGLPLDLTIADPGAVTWTDEGLTVDSPTLISSDSARKVGEACQGQNAITVEAWVRPAGINQAGPARIVTFSTDNQNRNFTLGQDNGLLDVRLRTSDTDPNGQPATRSDISAFTGPTVHVVYTREALDGEATVWINGQVAGSQTVGGDFSNWDMTYGFALANELNGERPWRGDLFLAAVYCRALDAAEVYQNFDAGY